MRANAEWCLLISRSFAISCCVLLRISRFLIYVIMGEQLPYARHIRNIQRSTFRAPDPSPLPRCRVPPPPSYSPFLFRDFSACRCFSCRGRSRRITVTDAGGHWPDENLRYTRKRNRWEKIPPRVSSRRNRISPAIVTADSKNSAKPSKRNSRFQSVPMIRFRTALRSRLLRAGLCAEFHLRHCIRNLWIFNIFFTTSLCEYPGVLGAAEKPRSVSIQKGWRCRSDLIDPPILVISARRLPSLYTFSLYRMNIYLCIPDTDRHQ